MKAYRADNLERILENERAYHAANRAKRNADRRERWSKDLDAGREARLKRVYGVDLARYLDLLEAQDGGCAICETPVPTGGRDFFSVDHDHSCCPGKKSCGGCVRGLLCGRCNTGIGMLRDDAKLVLSALRYLTNGLA